MELHRCQTIDEIIPGQTMVYLTPLEDRVRFIFTGNKWDNPKEFSIHCEREMEQIGNDIADSKKTNE